VSSRALRRGRRRPRAGRHHPERRSGRAHTEGSAGGALAQFNESA